MKHIPLDESPHAGPNKPKGGRSGHPGFNQLPVTEYDPVQLRELRISLALLNFMAGPGGSSGYDRSSSRRVDFYEQDPSFARRKLRTFLDSKLAECSRIADEIHQVLRDKRDPVDPTQCQGCGSGFAKGSKFCSRCGHRV